MDRLHRFEVGIMEAKPFDENGLADLIPRMCPKEWETQWKLSQKMVLSYNAKRPQEKSKGSSDGKRKIGHRTPPSDCIPIPKKAQEG